MSQLFTLPFVPALSLQGDFMASATLTFTLTGTTTAATVYGDAALTVPLGSVVGADAYGRFPSIYLDNSVLYRVVLESAQGVQIGPQVDPYGLNYGGETGAAQIGTSDGDTVQEALDKKANLDSPTFVNLPKAPTATLGDSSQQIANTEFVMRAANPAIGFSGLKVSSVGVGNFSSVITANAIGLLNSSGVGIYLSAVNVTAVLNTSGVNGLDTGSVAASTWYYAYVIYNPTTSTTASLFSLSSTAPTLPTGYTYFARVAAVQTQAASPYCLLPTLQYGKRVQYVANGTNYLPSMASGAVGSISTPTWVAIPVGAFIPPSASVIRGMIRTNNAAGGTGAMLAPNNTYGAFNSLINPPPIDVEAPNGYNSLYRINFDLVLESTNIYWASSGDMSVLAIGWEDNL